MTMKAYLIDPFARSVTETEYNGDYQTIAPAIGARLFTVAEFNDAGDAVFVDDEGLLAGPTAFFLIDGYPEPLAGKGLVLGLDADTGDSTAPSESLEQLTARVKWVDLMAGGRVVLATVAG